MHPPMHAFYHLPNLVYHLTPRPGLKPTRWRHGEPRPAHRVQTAPAAGGDPLPGLHQTSQEPTLLSCARPPIALDTHS